MNIIEWMIGSISLLYSIVIYCLILQRILNSNIRTYRLTFLLISLFFSSYLAITFLGVVNILKYRYKTFEIFSVLGVILAASLVFSLSTIIKYIVIKNNNTKLNNNNEVLKRRFDYLKYSQETFVERLNGLIQNKKESKEIVDDCYELYSKYKKDQNKQLFFDKQFYI